MKISAEKRKIVLTMEMEEIEARWLMGAMQNPMHGEHPDEEEEFSRDCRESLFNGIKDVLGKEAFSK